MKSFTASYCERRSAISGPDKSSIRTSNIPSGGTANVTSPAMARLCRLVARIFRFGQDRSRLAVKSAAAVSRCSQLSRIRSAFLRPEKIDQGFALGPLRFSARAHRGRHSFHDPIRLADGRQLDEPDAIAELIDQLRARFKREPRFACPTGARECEQPVSFRAAASLPPSPARGRRNWWFAPEDCSAEFPCSAGVETNLRGQLRRPG